MVNGNYVKVAEAGVSIPIGQFLKDQVAPLMPDAVSQAVVSIVGWILILVNTLLGASAFVNEITTKIYEAKVKVQGK